MVIGEDGQNMNRWRGWIQQDDLSPAREQTGGELGIDRDWLTRGIRCDTPSSHASGIIESLGVVPPSHTHTSAQSWTLRKHTNKHNHLAVPSRAVALTHLYAHAHTHTHKHTHTHITHVLTHTHTHMKKNVNLTHTVCVCVCVCVCACECVHARGWTISLPLVRRNDFSVTHPK